VGLVGSERNRASSRNLLTGNLTPDGHFSARIFDPCSAIRALLADAASSFSISVVCSPPIPVSSALHVASASVRSPVLPIFLATTFAYASIRADLGGPWTTTLRAR
jgi:hypothetical protein